MPTVSEMLRANPKTPFLSGDVLSSCISACVDCAQTCVACADACLAEKGVERLRRCIRLDLDCADVCEVTGRVLTRQSEPDLTLVRALVQACFEACRTCGDECAKHADRHEHCRICLEACRRCEYACRELLQALPATVPEPTAAH